MESTKVNLITILRDRVGELCEQGNFSEALYVANTAVEKAEKELNTDLESIATFASALEVRGDLFRQTGEWEKARADYRQTIDQLDNRIEDATELGRLHAYLGACHDQLNHLDRAIHHWDLAISYFEKATPPAQLDIASLSNNLAYLKKEQGDVDGAENAFLNALEIMHRVLGQNNEETASVCNNLGALYLQSGYFEQAREMHLMALDARRKLLGDHHIDTAQSYNNLALALIKTGDTAVAKRHFESAIDALESCGPDASEELSSVGDNYLNFLRQDGAEGVANLVEARITDTLAKWA
jgi:tetratricopeptide (TPR) repeat protein